jgi:membrane-associated progesterone receptor component
LSLYHRLIPQFDSGGPEIISTKKFSKHTVIYIPGLFITLKIHMKDGIISSLYICGRVFYGPGGPYALFAGKDASRALAKMSFEECDLTGDIEGLSPYELDALTDWEYKFMSKYVKVGVVKPSAPKSVAKEAPPAGSERTKSEVPVESDAPIETETEKVGEAEPTAADPVL